MAEDGVNETQDAAMASLVPENAAVPSDPTSRPTNDNATSNTIYEEVAGNAENGKTNLSTDSTQVLSKNQLKKLKRKQQWEDGREARKVRRKEKIKEKRERRRAAHAADYPEGSDVTSTPRPTIQPVGPRQRSQQAAFSIVFDCQYDDLMTDNERISLAGQITRAYSENRRAPIRAHLFVSSFGGSLRHRYEVVQSGHYKQWKGIRFVEEDFMAAAQVAREVMAGPEGGTALGALRKQPPTTSTSPDSAPETCSSTTISPDTASNTVYLSADSPNTLTHLHANTTYIIGGLVDRNRHKGACYKRAVAAGCRTARLPIGEFLARLSSRAVLTTTHVAQILLRWVEKGDWGEAMVGVVPERKGGGELKVRGKEGEAGEGGESEGEVEDAENNHDEGDYDGDDGEDGGEQSAEEGKDDNPTTLVAHDPSVQPTEPDG